MTPDTTNYMLAAYAVIFSVMMIYILSLFLRWRKLKKDLQTCNELISKG